jgi:hypothetical protein
VSERGARTFVLFFLYCARSMLHASCAECLGARIPAQHTPTQEIVRKERPCYILCAIPCQLQRMALSARCWQGARSISGRAEQAWLELAGAMHARLCTSVPVLAQERSAHSLQCKSLLYACAYIHTYMHACTARHLLWYFFFYLSSFYFISPLPR